MYGLSCWGYKGDERLFNRCGLSNCLVKTDHGIHWSVIFITALISFKRVLSWMVIFNNAVSKLYIVPGKSKNPRIYHPTVKEVQGILILTRKGVLLEIIFKT